LIEPIKESNKIWRKQQIKSKRSLRIEVSVPGIVIAIVVVSIFAYNVYNAYQQTVLQQQVLISQ
jgi:hypothetical protein